MKKRIILAAGAVLLAASVAVAVYAGKTKTAEQMLFEANVEALSKMEESGGRECYMEFKCDPAEQDVYCGTCEILPGRGSRESNCYKP